MLRSEQSLIDIIERGQSGIYDKNASLIRCFSGKIKNNIKLKNPLPASMLVDEIDRYIQIINPSFIDEIKWFKEAQKAIKIWVNELLIANRLLSINNDNEYDTRVFEHAIIEKFLLKEKPKQNTVIKTDFDTLVALVEMGARRFNH